MRHLLRGSTYAVPRCNLRICGTAAPVCRPYLDGRCRPARRFVCGSLWLVRQIVFVWCRPVRLWAGSWLSPSRRSTPGPIPHGPACRGARLGPRRAGRPAAAGDTSCLRPVLSCPVAERRARGQGRADGMTCRPRATRRWLTLGHRARTWARHGQLRGGLVNVPEQSETLVLKVNGPRPPDFGELVYVLVCLRALP